LAFYKNLSICDPSLGVDFLREIQGSLLLELKVRDVNRKVPDVCLFLHFGQTKDILAKDVE
jgi:hypothetical protein